MLKLTVNGTEVKKVTDIKASADDMILAITTNKVDENGVTIIENNKVIPVTQEYDIRYHDISIDMTINRNNRQCKE